MSSTTTNNQQEKIPCQVFKHADEASVAVAQHIRTLVEERADEGKKCVLGLATGSTPVEDYNELIRLHLHEGLSLDNL